MKQQTAARKKKQARISVSLADDEYAEMSALSDKHDVSVSWLARQAIAEFLERHRNEPLQLPITFRRDYA
jgi:metal-responsive CopG/Arc/MetJ family transcriptional regulator